MCGPGMQAPPPGWRFPNLCLDRLFTFSIPGPVFQRLPERRLFSGQGGGLRLATEVESEPSDARRTPGRTATRMLSSSSERIRYLAGVAGATALALAISGSFKALLASLPCLLSGSYSATFW